MYGIEIYILSRSQTFILLETRVVEINIQSKWVMQRNELKGKIVLNLK